MAITATIALTPSGTVIIEQQVMAVVTVNNSGGSDVNVLEMDPKVKFTGSSSATDGSSVGLGKVATSGVSSVVPAGGSAKFQFKLVFHEPSVNYDGTAGTYDVSCNIICSDGSLVNPTAATKRVNQVPKEASTP